MIKITVARGKNKLVKSLSVDGHAEVAEYGQDIVCAAVSALAQSVLLGLAKHLHCNVDYSVEPGYLSVALKDEANELTEAMFQVAILGFEEIIKQYPQNVNLSNIRR